MIIVRKKLNVGAGCGQYNTLGESREQTEKSLTFVGAANREKKIFTLVAAVVVILHLVAAVGISVCSEG